MRFQEPHKPPKSQRPPPLLPGLFDRLRDDEPTHPSEPASAYSLTAAGLRESIQRDLAFLLNTLHAGDLIDPVAFPLAADSCINFGVPPLAGRQVSSGQWQQIEVLIRDAISRHEPRLIPGSVSVRPLEGRHPGGSQGASHRLRFEIRAQIAARPYPLEFMVQSVVDLETNRLGDFAGVPVSRVSGSR